MRTAIFVASLLMSPPPGLAIAAEPTVHVLVPGFTVRPLPVRLTNVNNLAFAPDGRLFALGYDGRVHLLADTDGDGLEDTAEPYWDRPTIRVPVGLAWSPEGLYASSHGKVSLLVDDDGDGRADREEVVASGWPPTDVPSGGVDALGVTIGPDGWLYFGLGTPDYSNPYRVRDGEAQYDIRGERGTILKLSPDRRRREVVATGIRFPYALRFNRLGDLFATDQEGETWLPGGNPLDELNHIVPGRHYGFPPRHEEHLPGVIDEPPTVAFGPQHQSACGLVFNEAREGWEAFGPPAWEGDAFVAGFSRGKLWRVRLVKTPHGHVGLPTPFAASDLMAADVAISPSGDLYLTCHGGPPDWGSGPQGEGRLFKISYTDRQAPQPVTAWAAGPMEVRVAFDRPLDPAMIEALPGLAIPFGEHVRAADRLEAHSPPYQAVEEQREAPRGTLLASAARLEDGGRTLVLATDPHPWAATYALTLPEVRGVGGSSPGATVDLDYNPAGVEASWRAEGADGDAWAGWWPHADTQVVAALTAGSAEHGRQLATLDRPGTLTLRSLVRLPAGQVALQVTAEGPLEVRVGERTSRTRPPAGVPSRAEVEWEPDGEWEPLTIEATTGVGLPPFGLSISSYDRSEVIDNDFVSRPIPLDRLRPHWSPSSPAPAAPPVVEGGKRWDGGDPRRGEAVFFSAEARCSSCHKVRGEGGDIGPDLGNLAHRDAASVYRDIAEPDATVHPDYVPFAVALADGRVLTGLVRSEGDGAIRVTGTDAGSVVLRRDEVEELRPGATSIMPTGLIDALGEAGVRDLLAFLLAPPSAREEPGGRGDVPQASASGEEPPARTRAEVTAVLGEPAASPEDLLPLKILLVAGPQDHGPGEHDYPAWQRSWKALLDRAPGVAVETANGWPGEDQWESADLMAFYLWNHDWSPERLGELDAFLARGGGVVALHAALIADEEPEALAQRFGLAAQPVRTKYRHGPLDLTVTAPAGHPITRGLERVRFVDETYWPLIGDPDGVEVLATAVEEDEPRPMIWAFEAGEGRVFASVLGHHTRTLDDPLFRILALRGMAWAAREPARRFERLALDD
jgi:putative heme-binding domain-containing protein